MRHQKKIIRTQDTPKKEEIRQQTVETKTLEFLFDTAKDRYVQILNDLGQSRNGLMAFKDLSEMGSIPHKVLSAPYNALKKSPEYTQQFDMLCTRLAKNALETVKDDIKTCEVSTHLVEQYFKNRIDDNIRKNYRTLRTEYNILDAFHSDAHPRRLTIADVQEKIYAIYNDPNIGIKAFTKGLRDFERIALTNVEMAEFEDLLTRIENGPPMSESQFSKELHQFPHIDQGTISALAKAYGEAVLQWDMRLIRETGIFGTAEDSESISDVDIAKKWGEALDNVLKSIFLPLDVFINKLKKDYNVIDTTLDGKVVKFRLPISNELRNKSAFELFRYMETAESPRESSLAQSMLTLIIQYLLVDNHPWYKNAHLVNLQFDSICKLDSNNFSLFFKEEQDKVWSLDPRSYSTAPIDDDHILTRVIDHDDHLTDTGASEDSNLQDGSMQSAINSAVLKGGVRQEMEVFWRYWLSPEKNRMHLTEVPSLSGTKKPIRFHLVGRAVKSIDAILSKFHNRREHLDGIDDMVRARMVLDLTTEELESLEEVQEQVHHLAHDTAKNVLHLDRFIPHAKPEDLEPNSYTIVSKVVPLIAHGAQKKKITNTNSSRLWKDIKICGRTAEGTTVEIQLLPQDVYCLDLDPESPVSHTWYETDRLMDFIQSLLPAIYFKRVHTILNTIREERVKHKERITKEWEKHLPSAFEDQKYVTSN